MQIDEEALKRAWSRIVGTSARDISDLRRVIQIYHEEANGTVQA